MFTELVIKLGDSETCIYRKGVGLVLKEATMIAFSKRGSKISTVEVGTSAKELKGKTDLGLVSKKVRERIIAK